MKGFICDELLSEVVSCKVEEMDVKTLMGYNIRWKDERYSQIEGPKTVTMHEEWREVLTKDKSAEAF